MNKSCADMKKVGIPFPIGLGCYKCKSQSNALNLKRDIAKCSLDTYERRFPFDNKNFVRNHLYLGPRYYHMPHLKDFWADCVDDNEVRKRDWMRLSLA